MKRHAGKTGILILALIVALGGMGVAFAAWTDIITIQGTITTADIDWELTVVDFSWECKPRSETAWAIGPDSIEYEGPGGGWGQYFPYTIGDPALTVPLYAGQTIEVGEVRVETDGGNNYLIVDYDTTSSGWKMTETHIYVGNETPPKLAPGSFPYGNDTIDPPQMINLNEILILPEWDDEVYIAAHAVVTDAFGGCEWPDLDTVDHSIVVTLTGVPAGASGQLCFNILNIGTIPIRISDIDIDSPAGVTVLLVPPDPTGTQLHPGDDPVPVCVDIDVTLSGTYTVTITVDAVQWNM